MKTAGDHMVDFADRMLLHHLFMEEVLDAERAELQQAPKSGLTGIDV